MYAPYADKNRNEGAVKAKEEDEDEDEFVGGGKEKGMADYDPENDVDGSDEELHDSNDEDSMDPHNEGHHWARLRHEHDPKAHPHFVDTNEVLPIVQNALTRPKPIALERIGLLSFKVLISFHSPPSPYSLLFLFPFSFLTPLRCFPHRLRSSAASQTLPE